MASLEYETGLSIHRGYSVWIYGLYQCGSFLDINIVQDALKKRLDLDEMVLAEFCLSYG